MKISYPVSRCTILSALVLMLAPWLQVLRAEPDPAPAPESPEAAQLRVANVIERGDIAAAQAQWRSLPDDDNVLVEALENAPESAEKRRIVLMLLRERWSKDYDAPARLPRSRDPALLQGVCIATVSNYVPPEVTAEKGAGAVSPKGTLQFAGDSDEPRDPFSTYAGREIIAVHFLRGLQASGEMPSGTLLPSESEASASSGRDDPAPAPRKESEAKPAVPTPSEKPASSISWNIIMMLIVAGCGLLWLLLKRRS